MVEAGLGELLQCRRAAVFPRLADGVAHIALDAGGGGAEPPRQFGVEILGDEQDAVGVAHGGGDRGGQVAVSPQGAGDFESAQGLVGAKLLGGGGCGRVHGKSLPSVYFLVFFGVLFGEKEGGARAATR